MSEKKKPIPPISPKVRRFLRGGKSVQTPRPPRQPTPPNTAKGLTLSVEVPGGVVDLFRRDSGERGEKAFNPDQPRGQPENAGQFAATPSQHVQETVNKIRGHKQPTKEERKAAKAKNRKLRARIEDAADSPAFAFEAISRGIDDSARDSLVDLARDADDDLANPNKSVSEKASAYDAVANKARKVAARMHRWLKGVDATKVKYGSKESMQFSMLACLRAGARDAEARATALRSLPRQSVGSSGGKGITHTTSGNRIERQSIPPLKVRPLPTPSQYALDIVRNYRKQMERVDARLRAETAAETPAQADAPLHRLADGSDPLTRSRARTPKYPAEMGGKHIDLPSFTETLGYECAADCLADILAHFGMMPGDGIEEIIEVAGTDSEEGTTPEQFADAAVQLGLRASYHQDMTLQLLCNYLDHEKPVACDIQAHGGGHWIVATDYDAEYIYFRDPLNKSDAKLSHAEFEERWHDSASGIQYLHCGVACWAEQHKGIRQRGKGVSADCLTCQRLRADGISPVVPCRLCSEESAR